MLHFVSDSEEPGTNVGPKHLSNARQSCAAPAAEKSLKMLTIVSFTTLWAGWSFSKIHAYRQGDWHLLGNHKISYL